MIDFLDSNLRGAFEADVCAESDGYITASPDWLMQYVKLLFNTVYGAGVIRIDFKVKGRIFEIKADWHGDELNESRLRELKAAAEHAGFKFDIKYTECTYTATIKAELSELMAVQVYALSYNEIYEAFKRAFFL